MTKKTSTPAIRFKGFTDDWEQRRLGEVAVKISEKNSNLLIKETFTNSAEFGIISQRDFFDHDISNSDNISSYFVVDNDDFVYNPRISTTAPCGPINRNKLGRKGIMSPLYTVFKTYDIDALYLEWYFKSNYWHAFMRYNGDTGARSDRFSIRNELFFQMPIPFPKIQEQKQIGMTFESLDTLITLHQRKLDKLHNVKKSMLEKMFPKNGEVVPEIRFKGFTNAWEQRRLIEIATMHARIGWQNLRKSEFLDDGDYYLITGTDFVDGAVELSNCHYVTKERYDQDPNIQIQNGSILITKDGTLGKVAYIKGLDKPATLNAGVFNVKIRDKSVDGKYLFQYLKAPYLMDYVGKKATGGTIKHLNQNILVDFPIIMPSKNEQEVLGEFFDHLDTIITLHQRKLDKLKNIKKALLEKMFV